MAEVLGVAAGIAGLFSLTVQLTEVATKYKDNVGSVEDGIEAFIQELTGLRQVLEKLKSAWRGRKLPPKFDLSALAAIETACEKNLKLLLDKLTRAAAWLQRKSNFSFRGTIFRLKWPFEVERTREIANTLHRYFTIFSWMLHYHESELLFELSADVCKVVTSQERILHEIKDTFQYTIHVRQRVEAAIEISNNILKAVEDGDNMLHKICEGLDNLEVLHDIKEGVAVLNERAITIGEQEQRARLQIIEQYNNAERAKTLDQIPTLPCSEKQRQVFQSHHPGTGEWFLTDSRYQKWKNNEHASVLICKGIPGAGKTVLTSLAIEDVNNSGRIEERQVAYLYCDFRSQIEQTVPVLLSSILRQLLIPERLIFPFVRETLLALCKGHHRMDKLIARYVQLIRVLSKMSEKTYLFVDAVDEIASSSSGGKDVRNRFLTELSGLTDTCRLFIACRPHINTSCFAASAHCETIMVRAVDADLSKFVASSISGCKILKDFTESDVFLKSKIVDTILKKSNGLFLLAHFNMSRIAAAVSPRDILDILSTLSENLFDVYEFYLHRLRTQHPNKWRLAVRALSWIAWTQRPLTGLELMHALSFKKGDIEVKVSALVEISMIVEVCDGLIQLETPSWTTAAARATVSFTHATIADFMRQLTVCQHIHRDIANTCLGYLTMKNIRIENVPFDHQTQFPFFSYANTHWGAHIAKCQNKFDFTLLFELARESEAAMLEVLRHGLDRALIFLLESGISPNGPPQGQSSLMISVLYGQSQCTSILLKAGADVNLESELETSPYIPDKALTTWILTGNAIPNTALSAAALMGNTETVALLINAGAKLNIGRIPPLVVAIEAGHTNIVKQLLRAGCDANIKIGNKTPLYRALEAKNAEIIDALMDGGANMNATSTRWHITPLQLAISGDYWSLATEFISLGADPWSPTYVNLSPMQKAAYEGKLEFIQAIIQAKGRGIEDASRVTYRHFWEHLAKSPLHLALEGRHNELAQLLITNGAGVNQICGYPPYTPLEWAAQKNNETLVTQLLSAGADPNLGGDRVPLLSATTRFVKARNYKSSHSTTILRMLLDAGANCHVRDGAFIGTLRSSCRDNVLYRWWDWDDPTVRRFCILLELSEEWAVV